MPNTTRAMLFLLMVLVLLCSPALAREKPAGATPAGGNAAAAKKPAPAPAKADAERAALEKEFARRLTGAVLVGHYSIEGEDKPPAEERYEINKVSKLAGDLWLFTARIQFGGKDVTVPMPLPVKWAGDTPVISVTKTTIPGLGTYTARVLFYGDQYAGTWSGGDHGGHLWGRIERKADGGAEKPKSDPEAEPGETKEGDDGEGNDDDTGEDDE